MYNISIITCIYNQKPKYFWDCAISLKNQEKEFEWIIVDNASSKKLLIKYEKIINSLELSCKTIII